MSKKNKSESITGYGETTEEIKKLAGRVKLTDEELDTNYDTYVSRIENRNKTNPEKIIKILDREGWNKSKPSGESSEEIFIRLAKKRMPKIMKAFEVVRNLAKYSHTDAQTTKILFDLTSQIEATKIAFTAKAENTEIEDYEI